MSKLIITGIKDGKISYVEGVEVNTSIEAIRERVNELRGAIATARAISKEFIEEEHSVKMEAIELEYKSQVAEAESLKVSKVEAENARYEEAKANLVSDEEVQAMEAEEAKLTLILEGLRASEPVAEEAEEVIEGTDIPVSEVDIEATIADESAAVEEPTSETFTDVEASVVTEPTVQVSPVPQTVVPRKRIIF